MRIDRPRRAIAAAIVILLVAALLAPGPAGAQTSDDAAARAAREIQAARDRANAAAQAYLEAESELELLEDDESRLEQQAADLEATVEGLRDDVQSVALARFVGSGTSGIPLLTGIQDPQEQVQTKVFVDLLTNTGSDALDQYEAARTALDETREELEARRDEVERQRETFAQLQDAAEAEVQHLREVEAQRLEDEAVQRALEAQLAAQRAEEEAAARAAAEAAAREAPNPAAQPSEPEAQESAQVEAPGTGGDQGTTPAPSNGGSSGGTSGGRTGESGGGSAPPPPPPPAPVLPAVVGGIACPMPGSAYGDTYGAPRSGGRRHEGVDMLAPHGTPIYAVASGYASFKQTSLGGNSVSLAADDGTRYFYAHLSGFEGSSRRVSQGELIGYNGDTGNASGTPHLHFEVHPGGGSSINPTPTVRAAGC